MKSYPKNYHSPIGKFLQNITMFLLPYHWAYNRGYIQGAKKQRYFEGYADGQTNCHEFYRTEVLTKVKKWKA